MVITRLGIFSIFKVSIIVQLGSIEGLRASSRPCACCDKFKFADLIVLGY